MSWHDMPGVEYRGMPSIACPLIVDLTIDGRPAYVRYRSGVVRLQFEDGIQEVVGQAIGDEWDGSGEEKVVAAVRDVLLPRLRAVVAAHTIVAEPSVLLVKDFLEYVRQTQWDMRLGYAGDSRTLDYTQVSQGYIDKAISSWAAQRSDSIDNG